MHLSAIKKYLLNTNASKDVMRAVLFQALVGEERVLAYYSKTFNPPKEELRRNADKILAVVLRVSYFDHICTARGLGCTHTNPL